MHGKPTLVLVESCGAARLALAGGEPPEPPEPPDARLVIIYGEGCGRLHRLNGGSTTIGRSAANGICLREASVSRIHATVVMGENGVTIHDDGSENGTYVNGNRIGELRLTHGDLIKVGRSIVKFLDGDDVEQSYHDEIYRLSTVDGLTQVFNKRYFVETLERELSLARPDVRPLALIRFDIDHFKRCNDTFGMDAGDHVLRRLAALVLESARAHDVVARYGGDEFVVMLPHTDLDAAAGVAEIVRSQVAENRFEFDGRHVPATVSVGVAALGGDVDADALVKQAEARMRGAKRMGRNRIAL